MDELHLPKKKYEKREKKKSPQEEKKMAEGDPSQASDRRRKRAQCTSVSSRKKEGRTMNPGSCEWEVEDAELSIIRRKRERKRSVHLLLLERRISIRMASLRRRGPTPTR